MAAANAKPISIIEDITTGVLNFTYLASSAIFVGISLTKFTSIDRSCQASIDAARDLITYQIMAYLFTTFSTVLFQASTIIVRPGPPPSAARLWVRKIITLAAFYLLTIGLIFLLLSLKNYAQIKGGVVSCGGTSTVAVSVMFLFAIPLLFIMTILFTYVVICH